MSQKSNFDGLLASLLVVKTAIERLHKLGFVVLEVVIRGSRKPRVIVDHPPSGVQLPRGILKQTPSKITFASVLAGCQVEWTCPR